VDTSSAVLIDSESNLQDPLSKIQAEKKGESPKAADRSKTMDMPKMDHKKNVKKSSRD
jgi:hypothetical protein